MVYSILMALAPWEKTWILEKSLESIRLQSIEAELVIISTDGSATIMQKDVIDKSGVNVVVIEGPGKEGAGPVLQRGLEKCKTDLIVRADSDDINLPLRCELLLAEITGRPKVAAVGSAITEFRQDDPGESIHALGKRSVPVGSVAMTRFGMLRNPMNHQSTILRRKLVMEVGGYRNMRGFEDYDLWLRILANGFEIYNIDESLVWARVDKNHRARRRGVGYARDEYIFGRVCLEERLMKPWQVMIWLMLRLPTRLLNARYLDKLMMMFTRENTV